MRSLQVACWRSKKTANTLFTYMLPPALSFSFPKENDDCAPVPHEKRLFFLDFEGHFGRFPHFLVLAPEVGFQKHRLHDFWPWLQKLALSFSFPKENDDCASVPHEKRLVFFWILSVILEEFLTFWLWLQKSIPRSIDFMISGPGSRNLR